MFKSLTVVALVLLVLAGAMGVRNVAASNTATVSGFSMQFASGNGPFPKPLPGGGGYKAQITSGNGPFPKPLPGGGGFKAQVSSGNGPFPKPLPGGGGIN